MAEKTDEEIFHDGILLRIYYLLQIMDGNIGAESVLTSIGEYIDLFVEILRRLRPDLVVERFASEAPPRYHYACNWGLVRNQTLWSMLEKRLCELDAWQGEKFVHL